MGDQGGRNEQVFGRVASGARVAGGVAFFEEGFACFVGFGGDGASDRLLLAIAFALWHVLLLVAAAGRIHIQIGDLCDERGCLR